MGFAQTTLADLVGKYAHAVIEELKLSLRHSKEAAAPQGLSSNKVAVVTSSPGNRTRQVAWEDDQGGQYGKGGRGIKGRYDNSSGGDDGADYGYKGSRGKGSNLRSHLKGGYGGKGSSPRSRQKGGNGFGFDDDDHPYTDNAFRSKSGRRSGGNLHDHDDNWHDDLRCVA